MTAGPPAISVLLCTRNRPAAAARCLRSILDNPVAGMEVLVLDQGDEAMAVPAGADARLRHLMLASRGLARARNAAIRAARAPLLLFTDDDCVPDPGWVAAALAEFAADPGLDGLFGRVLPLGEGEPGQECPSVMTATARRLVASARGGLQESLGHGNNMGFRRSVFERHGLFMEWLGAGTPLRGGEDTEFVLRLLGRGARLLYSPAPLVRHDNWMDREASRRQLRGYIRAASVVLTGFALRGDVSALGMHGRLLRTWEKGIRRSLLAGRPADAAHFLRLWWAQLAGLPGGVAAARRRPPRLGPSGPGGS